MPSLTAVAIGATVLSTGVAVYGQQQQASAQSASANYAAQVADRNQRLANDAATRARAQGEVEQQQKANQQNQLLGQQRVSLAANGVDVNDGSAVDLQSDTAAAGTLDQLTIRSNAAREAAGYETQGLNYESQAAVDRSTAANATSAGMLASVGSVFGGAGTVANQWYKMRVGNNGYGGY